MTVHINGRAIGDGEPVYVTFEAGPTHAGVESALRLADAAARAGANALKFQIIDADRLCADRAQTISYGVLTDRATGASATRSESLYEILKRRELSKDDWRRVKRHCDGIGLAFFATVGFDDEVDFMAELGCHSIKIASADVDHHPLIEYAAKSGLALQLDTGHATLGEIEAAVDLIRRQGNENIIIHHCPTGYPARLPGINLNVITTLKRMFVYPVAFSDHTPGWEMDIAAVCLGANLIEKTITEDRATPSIEHIMSIEPAEAAAFVQAIRAMETALGNRRRLVSAEESSARMANRRSAHAVRDLKAGEPLAEKDVLYRRPGYGLRPNELRHYVGRPLRQAVRAGQRLSKDHF
jgi:N,N'-diacetyllegionaminate synthase